MRQHGLKARQKRRFFPCTTQSDQQLPIAPNRLVQIPAPIRPDQVRVVDTAYIAGR